MCIIIHGVFVNRHLHISGGNLKINAAIPTWIWIYASCPWIWTVCDCDCVSVYGRGIAYGRGSGSGSIFSSPSRRRQSEYLMDVVH